MNPRILGLMIMRKNLGARAGCVKQFLTPRRTRHSLGMASVCAKLRPELPAMRLSFSAPLFLLVTCANLFAETEPANSALGALKLLPRGEARRLARIEARDGTPAP